MRVSVVSFGSLREHILRDASGNSLVIQLPTGADVADLLIALELEEAAVFVVLIDGQRCDASTQLHEGDEVTLMPPFSGG